MLASALRKSRPRTEIRFASLDKNQEVQTISAIRRFQPNLVAITVYDWEISKAQTLANNIREIAEMDPQLADIYVGIGGPSPTTDPENAAGVIGADFAVRGAGELVLPAIAQILAPFRRWQTLPETVLDELADLPGTIFLADRRADKYIGRRQQESNALSQAEMEATDLDPEIVRQALGEADNFTMVLGRGCRQHCVFCTPSRAERQAGTPSAAWVMRQWATVAQAAPAGQKLKLILADLDFLAFTERNRELVSLWRDPANALLRQQLEITQLETSLASFLADIPGNLEILRGLQVGQVDFGTDGFEEKLYQRLAKGGNFHQIEGAIAAVAGAGLVQGHYAILSDAKTDIQGFLTALFNLREYQLRYPASFKVASVNPFLIPAYGTPAFRRQLEPGYAELVVSEQLTRGRFSFPVMYYECPNDPLARKAAEFFAHELAGIPFERRVQLTLNEFGNL